MAAKDFTVRVGQEEIGHILDRKENLDHHRQLWDHMSRYQALSWNLAVVSARGGADLGLDLTQPRETWWKQLADLGLGGVQVNLAVRTGQPSALLVLEVNKGEGALSLDLLGEWRAQCVAELGNREQHYYALPPGKQPPASFFFAREVLIYGEEGLVLAPPSIEVEAKEPWRWVKPPWVSPPQPPKAAVWQFLREQKGKAVPEAEEMLSWEEIYQAIVSHEVVLKALLVPPATFEKYYRDILLAAMAVGLRDRRVLLGLFWHAPHGDAQHNGERWHFLQTLLAGDHLPAPGLALGTEARTAGLPSPAGGLWPGLGPAPEPPAPIPAGSQALNGGMEDLTRQLLGEREQDQFRPKFDKSVTGQFFQLLASLGEQVISESCRQEAMLSGLEARATELDRLVAEIEQCFSFSASGNADAKGSPRATGAEFPWATVMTPRQKTKKLQEVKSVVQEFLGKNPDLAEDQSKVQMVLFCLKNYVSINPDFGPMTFCEKLEKAGQMARSFLAQPAKAL